MKKTIFRKFLCIFLVSALLLSMTACADTANKGDGIGSSSATSIKDNSASGENSTSDIGNNSSFDPTSSFNLTESQSSTASSSSSRVSSATSSKPDSSKPNSSKPNASSTPTITYDPSIRIMSYNILHPEWSSYADNVPIKGRDTIVANMIKSYLPDVIGVQEACDEWQSSLNRLLVSTGYYKQACKTCNNKTNMTTLYYNPKTVKLVKEYTLDLEKSSDIRVIAVAVFEKLADSKQFVVANAHPATPSQSDVYNENFAALTKHTTSELKKYTDIPFIILGDFNSIEIMPKFSGFISDTGLNNTRKVAKKVINDYGTYSEIYADPPKSNFMSIDHILSNGKASVEEFSVVIDHDVKNASDHLPIYADFLY